MVTIMPDFFDCALHQDALVLVICIAKFANIYTQTALLATLK